MLRLNAFQLMLSFKDICCLDFPNMCHNFLGKQHQGWKMQKHIWIKSMRSQRTTGS
ncbi:unnamed protein product [Rhodiola kirilowii]